MRYLATRARLKGEVAPTSATWTKHCRSWVTESLRRYDQDPKAEGARAIVVLTLARAITSLLWTGHVDEALALRDSVTLPHFGPRDRVPMSKKDWWAACVAGCHGSSYWEELGRLFPKLRTLGA